MSEAEDKLEVLDADFERLLARTGLDELELSNLEINDLSQWARQVVPTVIDGLLLVDFLPDLVSDGMDFAASVLQHEDPDLEEFLLLGFSPYVANEVLGRGLSVAELGRLIGRGRYQVYRYLNAGLGIFLAPTDIPARPGITLRSLGADGRGRYYGRNTDPLNPARWPNQLRPIPEAFREMVPSLKGWESQPDYKSYVRQLTQTMAPRLIDLAVLPRFAAGFGRLGFKIANSLGEIARTEAQQRRAGEAATRFSRMIDLSPQFDEYLKGHKEELIRSCHRRSG